jgi:transposase InsO family protein
MEFVARLKRGERMTDLCLEYEISRKTGHKIWNRYRVEGVSGLYDASRAPRRIPHRTPTELVELIVAARKKHPTWGPKKLKEVVEREVSVKLPAPSTIWSILTNTGLITPKPKRKRAPMRPTQLRETAEPNEVWCADYKGQFRLGNTEYCYPLTITDHLSRFVLCCEGMGAISDEAARDVFLSVFNESGLPLAIRTDNGVPFASRGLATLTRLSVLWLRLGIVLERIEPGHPEQNGRHERMHRTLKRDTTRPAAGNLLQQQQRFDAWVKEFNTARPHEALDMRRPADVFEVSKRPMPSKLPEPEYPLHDDVIQVGNHGRLRILRNDVYLAMPLTGEYVGVREEDDGRYLISFTNLDLGHVSKDGRSFTPLSG